jgi:hypothetical protein
LYLAGIFGNSVASDRIHPAIFDALPANHFSICEEPSWLNLSQKRGMIPWCDQIAIFTYLQRRMAHEADGTTVGDGDVFEPLFTRVSDTRPAARWEARDKIGSATNSASFPRSEGQADQRKQTVWDRQ